MIGLLVVATLNESRTLRWLLPELLHVTEDSAEIILVDDGSTDDTLEVARQCGVRTLHNESNLGKRESVFRALKECFDPKKHACVVTCDGDGQHPSSYVAEVLQKGLEEPWDVVFASRYHPKSPPPVGAIPIDRQLLCWMVRGAIGHIVPWGLTDPLCGLRAIKPHVAEWLRAQTFVTGGFGLELETVLRLWAWTIESGRDLSLTEVPIPPVYAGEGKMEFLYAPGGDALLVRATRAQEHLLCLTRVLLDLHVTQQALLDYARDQMLLTASDGLSVDPDTSPDTP